MAGWGYTINTDRQIDFDQNDRSEYFRVLEIEPSLRKCISCGSCTATCSSGQFTEFYNIRKLHLLLMRGEIEEIRQNIVKCMYCGKCQLVCPRGVNMRKVIMIMKEGVEKIQKNEKL